MNDTTTGRPTGGSRIKRGIAAAMLSAAVFAGVMLPADSAQAHLDYCDTGEYQYSDYYKVSYKGSRDEGGRRYHNYDHYYRRDRNSDWEYWYEEWKDCSDRY